MGTAWSREAAALLECDVEEPQEPSSKDINYEKFFKDIDELREVRKLYDDYEDTACPKRLPHDFKWWPQDERGVFKDEGIQLGLDGTPVETVDELYQVAEPARTCSRRLSVVSCGAWPTRTTRNCGRRRQRVTSRALR